MRINTQCSIALHCLVLIAEYQDTKKVTSELLAKSTGCNAAAIRSILNSLQKAGILRIARGVGGAYLSCEPSELTVWNVYHALEPEGLEHFIGFHPHPSEECPVGKNIHSVLKGAYQQISDSVQASMTGITLARLLKDYRESLELAQPETKQQEEISVRDELYK